MQYDLVVDWHYPSVNVGINTSTGYWITGIVKECSNLQMSKRVKSFKEWSGGKSGEVGNLLGGTLNTRPWVPKYNLMIGQCGPRSGYKTSTPGTKG